MFQDALSRDGYIINQDKTEDIPYGYFSSDINGCGWIAAYNLCKATGQVPNHLAISSSLAAGSPFGGRLGTGPRRLRRYMEAQGYRLRTAKGKAAVLCLAQAGAPGILLYLSGHEPHFVTFLPAGQGRYRFLNAIYGEEAHIDTMENFFAKYIRFPGVYMMVLDEEAL